MALAESVFGEPSLTNADSRPDHGAGQWAAAHGSRAFTLVELLISISIVAVLLAILLPALGYAVRAARGFRCQISLRSVAFDFTVFADDQLHGDRGDDPAAVGPRRFRLETFQESEYGIDEFWRYNGNTHQIPDTEKNDPMRCPAVRGQQIGRASCRERV